MAALPIGTVETTRAFTRPASRVRPEASRAPSGFEAAQAPAGERPGIAPPTVAAAPLDPICQPAVDDFTNSLGTLMRGLRAYHAQLAGRIRYFGPATPLDLRI